MDELLVAAKGVVPSVAAALVLVGALGRRWLALAIGLGLFGAYILLKGWPELPASAGIDGTQWILWLAAAAVLLAALEELALLPRPAATALGLALVAIQPWLVLQRMRSGWSLAETMWNVGVPALASMLFVLAVRDVARRRAGLLVPIVWTCALAVDAVVLLQAGSALLGQMAGAVSAALGAAAFTASWRRSFVLGGPQVWPLAVAHCGLLLAGRHFAFAPSLPALIAAAAAPAGLSLGRRRAGQSSHPSWLGLGVAVAALAGALVAALLAGHDDGY